MNLTIKKAILLIILTISVSVLFALPSLPVDGASPDCSGPWTCIPIDGGASILVALGVAFGGKKILDSRKKE